MSRLPEAPQETAKTGSLRRRLLLRISLATLLIYVLAATLSYRQAKREVQELMDGQMTKTARLILVQALGEPQQLSLLNESMAVLRGIRGRRSEIALEFTIARRDGNVLGRSRHAPDMPQAGALGFATIDHRGTPWRTATLETADGEYRVQVAQSIRQRNREALEIAANTILPLAVLLPLLIVLIYYSVRQGLKPLDDLADDVAARSPQNLEPLAPSLAPQEAQPLILALNELLVRLARALENERRFTADAAHELRTPLAALKVHAQVAMATDEPAAHNAAVAKVIAGADRATRLVEQLLRLARLDPLRTLPDPQAVDLTDLARRTCDEMQDAAARHRQRLSADLASGPVAVNGDADLLGAALRNLVDNALRYAPAGSSVCIRTEADAGRTLLEVRDSGRGVPPEELPRLAERFYRGRDAGSEGSGLGLAIVQRIADLHGARFETGNPDGGGFSARLCWPADGNRAA